MGAERPVGSQSMSGEIKQAAAGGGHAQSAGQQAEAAALAKALDRMDCLAAHTGAPVREAMLFGLGGGIGAAYFTFEYKSAGLKTIFLGTRINTQESKKPEFLQTICERIGLRAGVLNSGSASAAQKKLIKLLDEGKPTILWLDPGRRPYMPLTETPSHYHTVVAFGIDKLHDAVRISDLSAEPLTIGLSELAAARRIDGAPSMSYRAMVFEAPAGPLDLRAGIREGIRACVRQMLYGWDMGGFKGNFGIQGLRKWAQLLTDARNEKGWPRLFPPGADLLSALWSLFEQIENRGNGRGAFRPLYADFLSEAGMLLGTSRISDIADQMRASGNRWSELAAALLPETLAPAHQMRRLGQERKQLFAEKGAPALDEIRTINARIEELRAEAQTQILRSPSAIKDLLGDVQARVLEIARLEHAAMTALEAAME